MRSRILLIIALLLTIISCGEKPPVEPSVQGGGLELSVTAVHLDAQGTTDQEIEITSSGKWTASVSASWLKLSPSAGDSGKTVVSISGKSNDSPSSRSVDVLIYSDTDSKKISVSQDGRLPVYSCVISVSSIDFSHAYDYEPYELEVTAGEDAIDVDLTEAGWLELMDGVTSVPSNTTRKIEVRPVEPNYSQSERDAKIRFVGRRTGEVSYVDVTQTGSYQDKEESLHNLWRLTSTTSSAASWRMDGMITANYGDKKGILSVEAASSSNVTIVADGNNATFRGMRAGDAVLLRTPVKNIPAGTDVTAMINIAQKTLNEPREWIAEYWDDGKWNEMRKFETMRESTDYNCTTFIGDFTLSKPIVNDYVKVRFRMLTDAISVVNFIIPSPWYAAALVVNSGAPAIKETKKVLVLGNSFTYYWSTAFVLKQIARAQGYKFDMRVHTEPGISLLDHARIFSLSKNIIDEGGYDIALLQEKSTTHAYYFAGSYDSALGEAQLLAGNIRANSPSCRIILENTWSYSKSSYMGYGSYAVFDDKLRKGCSMIAEDISAEISPINQTFELWRSLFPQTNCLYTDGHHQSKYGTYLKSCINYLTICAGKFEEAPYLGEFDAEQVENMLSVALKVSQDNNLITNQ